MRTLEISTLRSHCRLITSAVVAAGVLLSASEPASAAHVSKGAARSVVTPAMTSHGAFAQRAAQRPAGVAPLPREAVERKFAKPPVKRARTRRAPGTLKAQHASLSTDFLRFGFTNCSMIATGMNTATITPPLIRTSVEHKWVRYWNTLRHAANGWAFTGWDGPYWLDTAVPSMVYSPRTNTWNYITEGREGTSNGAWPLGYAGLGWQYLEDYATGSVLQGWTNPVNGGAGGTCSLL